MKNFLFFAMLLLLTASCKDDEPLTEVFLPKIFGDQMVLQREQPIRIWGEGIPGKKVLVKFKGQEKETKIDKVGKWLVELDPLPAGGPYELEVNGKKFYDLQVGEVWLAGGQSNMEWVLSAGVEGLSQEIADSDYPLIRFFKIPHDYDAKHKFDVRGGEWKTADANNILKFSAIAWFFAKQNHLEKGIPIGIIESNWGGTPAEGWLAAEKLTELPAYQEKAKDVISRADYWKQEVIDNKLRELKRNELVAAPENGEIQGVANLAYNDSAWSTVKLPQDNPFRDIAWFRKKFTVNQTENVKLNLGDIQQMAYVYLNGMRLFYKDWGDQVNEMIIPAGMLKKGENLMAIRIINTWDNSPVLGKEKQFYLKTEGKTISLEGDWKYNNRVEEAIPIVESHHYQPGFMYNAMLAPILNYPIKGVIWYQGESNADQHEHYQELFSALITQWRQAWGIGDFPFLFVQLANWQERKEVQPESNWAFLREAQTNTLALPNTGMAVTIDVGNAEDIHPRNKKDVGHRLWLAAKKVAYGEELLFSGPKLKNADFGTDKVRLEFEYCGEGLKLRSGDAVLGFILAGEDGVFYPAKGKLIAPNQVEVSHASVKSPLEIRYAWADNPEVNLYNSGDLPAIPFRVRK
ncbi:hypothetical protein P872_11985 [Rhodonellum psychrophilum GCM71 = DSM 17998]|uniref:Sialate O-acetylesterase domain-containing protein n=2 Tax=Rhodonellum TaxID=336827 RepID=U5BKL0_9BACT|nr:MULTISPECIES: sialate O-acetylesterase [Rhodonellum]ERM81000.1 hypothetical protein P872_11985 [Rhodonellum psychrophilum GCM71 = DSM 17998]SDZ29785.1 sialate O-acetylesterase [Rhodonellum ikkaensis]